MYLEPAILTITSKTETPLQTNTTHGVLTLNRKTTTAPLNRPNANRTRPSPKKRDPFFTSFPGKELVPVPVEQETLSEAEAEKLLYVRP